MKDYEVPQDVIQDLKEKFQHVLQRLSNDLKKQRTGRATTSLLDDIKVESYGVLTPLKGVATLSTPEAKVILINPFDKSQIVPIEKAIIHSGLGLTPQTDGKVIRVLIPPLSDERRRELAKQIRTKGEDFKVAVRNIRLDAKKALQKMEKDKLIREDESHRYLDQIQKTVDQEMKVIDKQIQQKENELLEND